VASAHAQANAMVGRPGEEQYVTEEYLDELEKEMMAAAEALEFERAAALRDRIMQMREQVGKRLDEVHLEHATRSSRGRRRKKGQKGSGRIPKPERP
jgi:excinuclease ABC subunit B